jgi:pimeloyl-ACP methyl ester carboxylesterase
MVVGNGFRAIAYDRRGHGRSTQTWDGIREYYGAVPDYRRAEDVAVLCSYPIGDGVAGGSSSWTSATRPDGKPLCTSRWWCSSKASNG